MNRKIEINYQVFDSASELDKRDYDLLLMAEKASRDAYAPYSKFNVGAAVLLSNDKIVTASNQENAAYPSGLCAERVAVFSAHSQYPNDHIVAIAVSAKTAGDAAVSPCGACRQVMLESEQRFDKKIHMIFGHPDASASLVDGVRSLLPLSFDRSHLPERD